MIGIIGAMEIEIEKIVSKMESTETKTVSGIVFTKGFIGKTEVVCAVCGVGKVFAAVCVQTMILLYKPDCIINTGVAGTLEDGIGVLDAVIATFLVQHDMDTSFLGDSAGLISGINVVRFYADTALSEKLGAAAEKEGIRPFFAGVATGDCFIAGSEKKKKIKDMFGASVCEMEGAAIAHVCYINNLPFAVLRTISDGANEGAPLDYPEFVKIAAQKSADIMIRFAAEY